MWIAGHSFVYWGARRAKVRPAGLQLGFPPEEVQVRWIGVRGALWRQLLPDLQFRARLDRPPDVLVIHSGGNDLGSRSTRDILRDVKLDCLRLLSSFPGVILVWSDIVARLTWRGARSVPGLNRARAKLNRSISRFVARIGGLVIRHRELELPDPELIKDDKTHLNPIGTDIWTLGIKDGIERALQVWRDEHARGGHA